MKTNDIRRRFLEFFEKKGHKRYPSDSLVPANDPSVLFTGAGMNQFKDMFLGKGSLPTRRATSCQKCIRTGDIERVGKTSSHHTFFEMLGNFSFGDYFKEEAITWAWELLTKEFNLPPASLFVTVYQEDDEAFRIWRDVVKLPESKITRCGAEENFWPANAPKDGPNGPCGPCSEIYFSYNIDPERGCGMDPCKVGCPCNSYVEIWNLVFTQFNRQDGGVLTPLPQKNIDTGMGLERMAAVLQGVRSNFANDVFKPLTSRISTLVLRPYKAASDDGERMRRIADHVRAVTFLLADGVKPSNEGRGYVLRRVLRIAVRDGMFLGMRRPFLHEVVPAVADIMRDAYPEVAERRDVLASLVKAEEARFLETVETGTQILETEMEALGKSSQKTLAGAVAFKLYDTYGFPIEMTDQILKEKGFALDRAGFDQALQKQQQQARGASKMSAEIFAGGPDDALKAASTPATVFTGYQDRQTTARVLAIIHGKKLVDSLAEGQEGRVVLDRTPFYGEQGGQVGDSGVLRGAQVEFKVSDTQRQEGYFVHVGAAAAGTLRVGAEVSARIDWDRRWAIMKNHSATHLLQAALRQVLGDQVTQSGSLVAPDRLRFDFTHFQAMTPEQVAEVERRVNRWIQEDIEASVTETTMEEARKLGALMFFGEKYGEKVRVMKFGEASTELCGGTHLARTGIVGYFHITTETSIGSGVRRIEAVTGLGAVELGLKQAALIRDLAGRLAAPEAQIAARIEALQEEIRALKGDVQKARHAAAGDLGSKLRQQAFKAAGHEIVAAQAPGLDMDSMRTMVDRFVKTEKCAAALLMSSGEGKVNIVLGVRPDLAGKPLHAGNLIKEVAAVVGGGGGGRPDMAQAGGKDPGRIKDALFRFKFLLETLLS